MINPKTHTCFSCGLKHYKVECQGIWHCPNALCKGSGGGWFRRTLKSYKEIDDNQKHTVDEQEWRFKGIIYNLKNGIRRYNFYRTKIEKEEKMIDNIHPVGKRVLIVPHKEDDKKSSLILPDQKDHFYKVVAKSAYVDTVNCGDIVLVNIYHGNVYRHPDFLIVDESTIVGIKR